MSNLQITVTVIAIAVAQALTILLTLGRERDIKELRELVNELRQVVDEQRLRIVELRAWLAGRNAAQPSLSKAPEPAAQAMKVLNWQREIVAGLQAGLKGARHRSQRQRRKTYLVRQDRAPLKMTLKERLKPSSG